MLNQNCNTSLLKEHLLNRLAEISSLAQRNIDRLNNENICLLQEFESMKTVMTDIVTTAASFYLKCYLSPYTSKYEDLTICVRNLSERRHGALIVVERNDPLDSLIRSSVPIGGMLSHPLVESIFYPGNPLHDGAVLVRSETVVSAANILPLTDMIVTDRKLGTRHRAAIGLTERCDALVLVVSEETGQASFAIKGTLHPFSVAAY
ncbi:MULTISPECIES: sporulation-specific diadenylate cyclase CdaS [unclassified Paenibacillus]|uniref:sporulation-specific diadenylate cyclase CdaS n=1 Tax=unclassified Paenibacillus TaxID=185978 RepID=UPI001C1270B7|nr:MULTISPECIES: sporulation-specific diadenylate cyclase CdaS [unclassified Paenibacillus]MBU5443571.1 sporulation-specific diadenylate cyclase CdaS [Paenibacillus sp. MSJ-34]CAH0119961.1 Diadenylate cyclase CdaS [Paenibacillus sp. CECT 9249]